MIGVLQTTLSGGTVVGLLSIIAAINLFQLGMQWRQDRRITRLEAARGETHG